MTDEIKIHCAHDRLVDVTELVPNNAIDTHCLVWYF